MIDPVQSTVTLIGAAFALFGLVFVTIGGAIARSAARFRRHAGRTTGTIVALRMRHSSSSSGAISGPYFLPTVAFTTRDGREIRAEAAVGSNPPPGRVGRTVGVLYDPDQPERFRVDTLLGRGGCIPVVFIVIGIGFVGIGALMLSIASG